MEHRRRSHQPKPPCPPNSNTVVLRASSLHIPAHPTTSPVNSWTPPERATEHTALARQRSIPPCCARLQSAGHQVATPPLPVSHAGTIRIHHQDPCHPERASLGCSPTVSPKAPPAGVVCRDHHNLRPSLMLLPPTHRKTERNQPLRASPTGAGRAVMQPRHTIHDPGCRFTGQRCSRSPHEACRILTDRFFVH
jgi:hypothetical protein